MNTLTAGNQSFQIPLDSLRVLEADLYLPVKAKRIVLFACKNTAEQAQHHRLARVFQMAGFATLVFDVCTLEPLGSERLMAVSDWVALEPRTRHLEQAHWQRASKPKAVALELGSRAT